MPLIPSMKVKCSVGLSFVLAGVMRSIHHIVFRLNISTPCKGHFILNVWLYSTFGSTTHRVKIVL
jgi:hypothetical protein